MKVYAGLAGIPVVKSSISYIDGQKGILEYRGIPIQELVESIRIPRGAQRSSEPLSGSTYEA